MLKINSKTLLLAILGISVLLITLRFFTLMSFPDARTLDKGDVIKIFPGQTFSQRFTANRDNLEAIQILLRTPGIKSGDTVTMELADANCRETLREGTLKRPFLNTDDLYLFTFPRVERSAGETYCLLLSYRTTQSPSKYLRFFTVEPDDPDFLLTNTALNAPINGQALSLRTVSRNDHFWQDLAELNRRISQYKPWFLKDFFIGTIAILFIVLSITLIAILITANIETDHTPNPLQKKEKP
jgi:hypothetical protein